MVFEYPVAPCHTSPTLKFGTINSDYGTLPDGRMVQEFTLENAAGMRCKIITYGGILTEWSFISQESTRIDIVLGVDCLDDYLAGHPYFGAITGRVAGRISGARFTLDNKEFNLAVNDPPNHLHGGHIGLDKRLWNVEKASASSK